MIISISDTGEMPQLSEEGWDFIISISDTGEMPQLSEEGWDFELSEALDLAK